mgnify:CR=1 FL=1
MASASVARDFMTSRAFLARDVFISPSFAAVTSLNFCAFTESRPFSPSKNAASEAKDAADELGSGLDSLQSAYGTLKDATDEYNGGQLKDHAGRYAGSPGFGQHGIGFVPGCV